MARCTTAAATAESTPPDSPQIARPSGPTCARIRSTCSSTMLTMVHVGRQPAMSCRKCSRTAWPCSVCITSGCHWTPARRRSMLSNAATVARGRPGVDRKPSGAAVTSSPWDIHETSSSGTPSSRVPGSSTETRVRPYSRCPVRATVAAERLGHRHEAVADAEDRYVALEQARRRGSGRPVRRPTTGPPERMIAFGLAGQHLLDRHVVRDDLGVDLRLTHPAGDQLGVLGPEVDDEDEVVVGQLRAFQRRLDGPPILSEEGVSRSGGAA